MPGANSWPSEWLSPGPWRRNAISRDTSEVLRIAQARRLGTLPYCAGSSLSEITIVPGAKSWPSDWPSPGPWRRETLSGDISEILRLAPPRHLGTLP